MTDKREYIKKSFSNIDNEVFRTNRDKRLEKKRRKQALTRFDRRESKRIIRNDEEN